VNKDRSISERILKQAEECGIRGVFVTVDQPTPGKREADERVKADAATLAPTPNGATARNDSKGSGLGRTMAGFIDASLNWQDIKWLRRATRLPIVLKGVQTAADAIRAVEHGIDGLLIGNHGGRSLDTSPPAIMILLELRLTCPDIFNQIEVYVDGGIRRGTDIFKALCLGAKAVGMGRPFLYAATYGPQGVAQLIESKFWKA
jgi:L-lactate dehydrogenase (cytochrome)